MTLTPDRITELRRLAAMPAAELVAQARLRGAWKRGRALGDLGTAMHVLPELLDEIDRLRAVIRETHTLECWGENSHAPTCKLYEIEP